MKRLALAAVFFIAALGGVIFAVAALWLTLPGAP